MGKLQALWFISMLLSDIWATSSHDSQPNNPFLIVGKHDIEDWVEWEDGWKVRNPQHFNFSIIHFSFIYLFVCLFSHMEKVSWKSHYFLYATICFSTLHINSTLDYITYNGRHKLWWHGALHSNKLIFLLVNSLKLFPCW